jgi:hypothetical protein
MHNTAIAAFIALFLPLQSPGILTFTAPDGWTARKASSSMRVAEFTLAKVEGDAEDADVVVYYFGGQGGDVQANIDRWLGQMQQPDGRASKDVATRSTRTANGLEMTVLDLAGTYVAEVRPGAAERFNKPAYAMRAVVIQTPRGPHFVKVVGPQKTMARWLPSTDAFLKTVALAK